MMVNAKIQIIWSRELIKMRLKALLNRTGAISNEERLKNGYWIILDQPYQNEKEWFVPKQSIQLIKSYE